MLNVKYLHHKKLINNKTKSLLDRIASNKSYQIKGQCLNDSLTHYYSWYPNSRDAIASKIENLIEFYLISSELFLYSSRA